jgi:RNA polymerase sigma-70 factor (ECF subfamily)
VADASEEVEHSQALAAARRGSREAQALLLNRLQDVWYRMCLGLLGDADRARDATQETALRFLKQLPGFRGESRLQTWSLGIAINVAREMRRRDARPTASWEGMDLPDERPASIAPLAAAEAGEARDRLHRLLADLPTRQREAIILRFFEQLSVEQTAAVMKCAGGTVKATIHQALRSLREKLGHLVI